MLIEGSPIFSDARPSERRIIQLLLCTLVLVLCSCKEDDPTRKEFSDDEIIPIVEFTWNEKPVTISSYNWGGRASADAMDANGQTIDGVKANAIIATMDSSGVRYGPNPKHRFFIWNCVHASPEDLEPDSGPIPYLKPEVFKSLFVPGPRLYSPYFFVLQNPGEVVVSYYDGNSDYWASGYWGDIRFMPTYDELQPNSVFTIERAMPFGDDSVFVEVNFKVRLYKNQIEFVDIDDGYFKGFFYRKNK